MGKLVIISGDDDFTAKAHARAAAADLCRAEPEKSDMEIIDSEPESIKFPDLVNRLLDTLRTPPMFADSQYIWIRNFGYFDELAAAYKEESSAGVLAGMLAAPLPEEQSIILNGPGFDQRKSWAKAVKAAGASVEICASGRAGDRNFAENRKVRIREWCEDAGKHIASSAIGYIEEISGSDPGTLYQEVAKVIAYAGAEPEISLADCRAVCSRTPEAMGWNFTGALVARNAREALTVLDTLLKQGDAEIRVLAMVSSEFQGMIKLRQAMRELHVSRVNPHTFDSIPQELRDQHPDNMLLKLHPYRAFKMCEGAARFGDEELARILHAVLKANRALVSGGGDRRIVLEQMIFEITGVCRTC